MSYGQEHSPQLGGKGCKSSTREFDSPNAKSTYSRGNSTLEDSCLSETSSVISNEPSLFGAASTEDMRDGWPATSCKRIQCSDYLERMACPNGRQCPFQHDSSGYRDIIRRNRHNRREELLAAYPEAAILEGANRGHSLLFE